MYHQKQAERVTSTPIIEDFAIESDYPKLQEIEQRCATAQGIERTMHRIIWVAEKQWNNSLQQNDLRKI
ncbi:hypothetical protein XYCOK13_24930 [Xylanibacillus composti]|uniref:Uncharacterized protein n=1 Tax=Xylanibacillus composti TaxID=1572762 RepID=A0A8J4H6C4_9BACL|nr:hypothetical protein XYCOK13_24930 [Xylanibacillus composti]